MAATWRVTTEVTITQTLQFEIEVEADSALEAESKAEDEISHDMIIEKLNLDDADYDSEAETDDIQCDGCGEYFPSDGTLTEVGSKLLCDGCKPEDEEEDEDGD